MTGANHISPCLGASCPPCFQRTIECAPDGCRLVSYWSRRGAATAVYGMLCAELGVNERRDGWRCGKDEDEQVSVVVGADLRNRRAAKCRDHYWNRVLMPDHQCDAGAVAHAVGDGLRVGDI